MLLLLMCLLLFLVREELLLFLLVVRLAHQERPTAGSTLWLHLAENQLHLFDGETGQRV